MTLNDEITPQAAERVAKQAVQEFVDWLYDEADPMWHAMERPRAQLVAAFEHREESRMQDQPLVGGVLHFRPPATTQRYPQLFPIRETGGQDPQPA